MHTLINWTWSLIKLYIAKHKLKLVELVTKFINKLKNS